MADQEIEQEVTCPVSEGSDPLSNGGASRARRGQSVHQPVPTQTHDQVERNGALEQANHVMAVGMQEVRQQAVRVAADLAPNPLHQDAVVDVASAGRALVGAPADQATAGLAIGMRTDVRDGEAATGEGDGFGVLLYRTGEVLYNDHALGTPPFVVGLPNLETRRGVSSFLAWMGAASKRRVTCWRRAIIPGSAPLVKLGCGYDSLLPLSCRSSSMTAHPEVMTGPGRLAILFGRDWPYFNQRKWPITS